MARSTGAERIEAEALRLSPEERADLARRLFASIEDEAAEGPAAVEEAWIEEAERRYQRYLSGGSKTIDWTEALSHVRAALRRE